MLLLLVLVLSACASQPGPSNSDTAPVLRAYTVRYGQHFTIECGEGYKKLTVTQPWACATEALVYFLIPRGAPAPKEAGSAQVIETPVRSFVAMSTT